jgi:hypothetical protein
MINIPYKNSVFYTNFSQKKKREGIFCHNIPFSEKKIIEFQEFFLPHLVFAFSLIAVFKVLFFAVQIGSKNLLLFYAKSLLGC